MSKLKFQEFNIYIYIYILYIYIDFIFLEKWWFRDSALVCRMLLRRARQTDSAGPGIQCMPLACAKESWHGCQQARLSSKDTWALCKVWNHRSDINYYVFRLLSDAHKDYYPTLLYYFFFLLLVFFAPVFQCVLSPWAVHPWPTCHGSLLKTLESCPDGSIAKKKTPEKADGFGIFPNVLRSKKEGTNGWMVSGCHWGLVAEVQDVSGFSSRGGGIAASCLNGCVFKLLFSKEIWCRKGCMMDIDGHWFF